MQPENPKPGLCRLHRRPQVQLCGAQYGAFDENRTTALPLPQSPQTVSVVGKRQRPPFPDSSMVVIRNGDQSVSLDDLRTLGAPAPCTAVYACGARRRPARGGLRPP